MGVDRPDSAGRAVGGGVGPDEGTVQQDLVFVARPGGKPLQNDDGVVVTGHLEGSILAHDVARTDLDGARSVGFHPDRGVDRADVAEHRPQPKSRHALGESASSPADRIRAPSACNAATILSRRCAAGTLRCRGRSPVDRRGQVLGRSECERSDGILPEPHGSRSEARIRRSWGILCRRWAGSSMAEQLTLNQLVGSSSLPRLTSILFNRTA